MSDNNPAGADPVQSFEEMVAELNSTTARLESVQTKLTQAQTDYQTKTEKYYFPTDEAREQARKDLLPTLEPVEQEAARLAGALSLNARRILEATKSEAASQTDAEVAVADSKREFVKEDCTELDYRRLLSRVQQAINQGDRPAMWLYLRYGTQRLAHADKDQFNTDEVAKSSFAAALRSIEGSLTTGKAKSVNDHAFKVLRKAQELERAATKRRMANRTFVFQQPGDVAW